jgi:hypothetical protein
MEMVLLTLLAFQTAGFSVFGKFQTETPWWQGVVKWTIIVAVAWGVAIAFGITVAIFFVAGINIIAVVGHFAWCYRHGIDPVMATPRKKYYELRGWKWRE